MSEAACKETNVTYMTTFGPVSTSDVAYLFGVVLTAFHNQRSFKRVKKEL